MKNLTNYLLPLALFLPLSETFADNTENTRISMKCRSIVTHLEAIARQKPEDACTGDIEIATSYLRAANTKITHNKYEDALLSLHRSENELYHIAYTRNHCEYFALSVKRELGQLIEIISEVEVLEHIKA